MTVEELGLENVQKLIELRQKLHTVAELSGKEFVTSKILEDFLKSLHPDTLLTEVGGTGIIATWDSGLTGPDILLRADMDALPIKEMNEVSYKSENPYASHACGHDGHSVILCAVAQMISLNKPGAGKVRILFQPSEENGKGAQQMLRDEKLKDIHPDYVFALHNIPGYPLHSVIVRDGSFSAAVNSILIDLNGKTSHASEPENGINPALAMSEIFIQARSLENNNALSENMKIMTPVYALLGEKAYGTSAGHATAHFTLRCWKNNQLHQLENSIREMSQHIAAKHHVKADFDYAETFYATENNKDAVDYVRKAIANLGLEKIEKEFPFKWGEDFGMFTKQYKGCMFGLGAGEQCPALHNPDYDFPDVLIETGANIFLQLIDHLNNYYV